MSHPVKIQADELSGAAFDAVEAPPIAEGEVLTADIEVFRAADEEFSAGVWRSSASFIEFNEPYPYNEYMQILEGSVTLTCSDGTVTELQAGDSVVLPRGWTGTWDTPGCRKIYVIHAPDKDL